MENFSVIPNSIFTFWLTPSRDVAYIASCVNWLLVTIMKYIGHPRSKERLALLLFRSKIGQDVVSGLK